MNLRSKIKYILCIILLKAFLFSDYALSNDESIEINTENTNSTKIFWEDKKFNWFYSDENEPNWLNGKGVNLFKNAAIAWKNCGVDITFNGTVHITPLEKKQVNVLGWMQNNSQKIRGITIRVPYSKNSTTKTLKEVYVAINALNIQLMNDPRLLQKVVTHEFGHALGLVHSSRCDDVMSSAAICGASAANPPPTEPTPNDLSQCKNLYFTE
jgi:Matrixin